MQITNIYFGADVADAIFIIGINERTNGQTDERTNGQTGGWTNGRTDRLKYNTP